MSGRNGGVRDVEVALPSQSDRSAPPLVRVSPVCHRTLDEGVGYIGINSFPGDAGTVFARTLDDAVKDLADCSRMIFDLRGNIGGGLGSLRLMSYLCPDRRPIGYNLSRKRADRGYRKEDLVRIDRIPFGKLNQLMLFVRFKYLHKDRSIALWTEGLGARAFHGRIAIIVNEHTKSAAEMVADFASANGLATLVGTQTAGEFLGAVNFRLAYGYKPESPSVAGSPVTIA
ncbi:MAG: hypothetical protein IPJ98_00685 [Bryobacterales bacterium]|nr:hypothetical protein [Bryobacterales bacterium]